MFSMTLGMGANCIIDWTDQAELGLPLSCILRHLACVPAAAALWGRQLHLHSLLLAWLCALHQQLGALCQALFLRLVGAEFMHRLHAAGWPAMSSWLGMFLVMA